MGHPSHRPGSSPTFHSGWGQGTGTPAGHKQGDLGVGVLPPLSVSQQITQRSIERNAGAQLNAAVKEYLRAGTPEALIALRSAHEAFEACHA